MQWRILMSSWKTIVVTTLVAVSSLASTGYSQLPDDEESQEELRLNLEELSRNLEGLSRNLGMLCQDVAEEYLDILENLQDVLEDYSDYMEELDEESSSHQVAFLETMQRNLRKGSYNDNPEKLLDDIYEAVDEIKAIERQHRVKFNTNNPRCCRLSANLRKELVITAELVEDYTDQQAVAVLGRDDIKKYMKVALEYFGELEKLEAVAELEGKEARELVRALEALGLMGKNRVDVNRYPMPGVPDMPDMPDLPDPPKVIYHSKKHGKVGACHQSFGTIQVSHKSWPIIIENRSGDIVVTGSDSDVITATFDLEIAAASHAKEKAYLDKATLTVGEERNRYYVSVDLPHLSDPRTDLVTCILTVVVPDTYQIECNNAFGRAIVSGLRAGVVVDGENSRVELSHITGDVDVDNSMGPVTLEEINGRIRVETSYAPIDLTECRGDIEVENEYSSVTVLRTEGRLEIMNSGQIDVSAHTGDLHVENMYGTIEVEDVDGDVVIKNGYQPIIVSDISGSAELDNEYSEISTEDIGGSLYASTSHGPIYAESLDGPVDLNSYYGNISVVLNSNFRGGSTITNTEGTVKVTFFDQPDLVLSIHTIGGTISSSLPISVRTRGNSKSAELILGEGGERLELSGSNTAIIIQGR